MRKFQNIIVGSGISGLTLSLLLAMNGQSVLLIEKGARIGGSLVRFSRNGVPFDTGFHFTGGFAGDKLLARLLKLLGIENGINPIFLSKPGAKRIFYEDHETAFDLPHGYEETILQLKDYFPAESKAIDSYFDTVRNLFYRTSAIGMPDLPSPIPFFEEDGISLDEYLGRLTNNTQLKGVLSIYALCHGVKPTEISLTNHSMVSYGLYASVARVEKGGDAFIEAFQRRLDELDITVECNSYIEECADISDKTVRCFILNTGEGIAADRCIFTIHPGEIVKTLPREHLSKAFVDRVNSLESSAGFFALYGVVEPEDGEIYESSIVSLVPTSDFNHFMDPSYRGPNALAILRNTEQACGKSHNALVALEFCFPQHMERWENSKTGSRPPDYREYKQRQVESMVDRILKVYPEYRSRLKILDCATTLTFRDYLNSPDGSAYGVKQKLGQFNLFGRLPLRNLYAAGQSAVMPGILGAMTSSFLVLRTILGKNEYKSFVESRQEV